MRSSKQFLMIAITMLVLLPMASRADVNYTFIKVDCSPDLQSMTIRVFYDWNESGEDRVERHEKDTYYFDEIAKEPRKIITCDLGDRQVISFFARQSLKHPGNNNIPINLNNMNIPSQLLQYPFGEAEMVIRLLGANEVSTRICKLRRNNKIDESTCKSQHIKNGTVISE